MLTDIAILALAFSSMTNSYLIKHLQAKVKEQEKAIEILKLEVMVKL